MKLSLGIGKHDKKDAPVEEQAPAPITAVNMDEIAAAIGLALSLHMQDIHDYEKTVITMQKVMRPYSPWSSKIYGLRERPMYIPRSRR
ncbi:MAG: hypothetical protein HXX13_07300 [Bacteroidetes bacterium]|nr:hypothetical protein [Bacteroidota bacterium]